MNDEESANQGTPTGGSPPQVAGDVTSGNVMGHEGAPVVQAGGVWVGGNVQNGVIIAGNGNTVSGVPATENKIVSEEEMPGRSITIEGDVKSSTVIAGNDNVIIQQDNNSEEDA